MALDFARPSPTLMREFETVARQAGRFAQALRQANVDIDEIKQPLLDNIGVLEALPRGTAEAGRILLDHTNNRLNEIRSEYFAIEPDAQEDKSGAQRGVPLDDAFALLIAAIGTALATANREAGERRSTLPPTEARPASAASGDIETGIRRGQVTISDIEALRAQGDRILKRESERVDLLSRRLTDAESLTREATAELQFTSVVTQWIRRLGKALAKTPKLLRGAADVIDTANDVVSLFYDQFRQYKKDIEHLIRSNIPKFTQNLRSVADRLEKDWQASAPTESVKPPDDFDLDVVRKRVLAGQVPPRSWIPWISGLDFNLEDRLTDITPLQSLTALQTLSLDQTQVADLTPLQSLTALQTLSLDQTQVADLTTLQSLTALQTLSLDQTQVADLTTLQSLTALKTLSLDQTQVADLTPLQSLTALQTLWLNGTQVADLTPLQSLTALQTLSLDQTQVADLTPLQSLTALQTLRLNGTQVADLTPLQSLTALQDLSLDQTQVADLTPLQSLTALKTLSLDQTQVRDLKPLTGLPSLEAVWVENERRRRQLAATLGRRGAIVKVSPKFVRAGAQDGA